MKAIKREALIRRLIAFIAALVVTICALAAVTGAAKPESSSVKGAPEKILALSGSGGETGTLPQSSSSAAIVPAVVMGVTALSFAVSAAVKSAKSKVG